MATFGSFTRDGITREATSPEQAVRFRFEGWQETDTGLFDPAEHTVDEVKAHLADADPAEQDRVLQAERAGKDRSSLTG